MSQRCSGDLTLPGSERNSRPQGQSQMLTAHRHMLEELMQYAESVLHVTPTAVSSSLHGAGAKKQEALAAAHPALVACTQHV